MKNEIYLSSLAGKPLIEYLTKKGFNVNKLNGNESPVYNEVSTHADIHMCQLGLWEKSCIFPGNIEKLESNYPGNIIYNAVCTGKYFIHNLKYTDNELLTAAEKWQHENYHNQMFEKIHVRQGYTRCCCMPVNDTSFITSDEGITKALSDTNADVLLIEKGNISLPGFDYGFIGGCTGHLLIDGKKTIIFNGNLTAHPDYKKIAAFIKDRDIDILCFESYPLTDIGSILI